MTLRRKIIAYLVVLHLAVAGVAAVVLYENPLLLFVVEILFAISIWVSYRLVRELFVPLDLIRTGADLIAEQDFTSHFSPVGQPEMDGLIAVYNRMIDRLREERLASRERGELLQKIVDASPSGVIICGFDGEVEQMNPAARQLVNPPLLSEIRQMGAGESRLVSGGAPQRLRVRRAEFRDRGFAKTFFLIDELTEELRVSEKAAYEKLIRMMSHEVNNSVGSVRSLLESSMRYAPQVHESDREDFTTALTVASGRIEALNRFMKGFADVVRIPAPHRVPTQVSEIVRGVVALVRPELESRAITLDLHLGDPVVSLDPHQFEQVVINIVRNAIDAIDGRGSIRIELDEKKLAIADSGGGIPQVIAADLFTPFFTTKRDGRGLGLTIVQEILTNHGFSFSLTSRAAGGAEFVIRF